MSPSLPKKILITGGSGFIGTNAQEYCINNKIVHLNLDISPPKKEAHKQFFKKVDIRNSAPLKDAIEEFQPHYILHLAAATGMDVTDYRFFDANTIGVKNLLEIGNHLHGLSRLLAASSLLVCKNGYIPKNDTDYCPPNLYGKSKVETEQLVRAQGPNAKPWVLVRPTSVWGPWVEHIYKEFFIFLNKGVYFHPGRKEVMKPVSFVGNTVHMMMKLLMDETGRVNGKTFYLADYPPISIRTWAELIRQELNAPPVRTLPMPVVKAAAISGDILKLLGWKRPLLTSFRLGNMMTGGIYPYELTKNAVGDLPFTVEQGIKQTVSWLKNQEFI